MRGEVIIGLRPESFEDAALVGRTRASGITFRANIDVLESMGSESFVYFRWASPNAYCLSAELDELAQGRRAQPIAHAV